MNSWNQPTAGESQEPIRVIGRSIATLHKILKEEDLIKAMRKRDIYGEPVKMEPSIAIDFTTVTSIQEDYKNGGTIIMDRKTAVIVKEKFAYVLEVWPMSRVAWITCSPSDGRRTDHDTRMTTKEERQA